MAPRRPSPPLEVVPAAGAPRVGGLGQPPGLVPTSIARELLAAGPASVRPVLGVVQQRAGGLIRDPNAGQSAGPPGLAQEPQVVHHGGGGLLDELLLPGYERVAQLYKALPEDGWFDPSISPSNPISFQLGVFEVPRGTQYWLFEYDFFAFRQSGVDPADSIVAEEGRFSTVLGFDLTIDGWRSGNLLYQLDPVPVQLQKAQFQPQPGRGGRIDPFAFDIAAAESFATAAGPGLSLLPPGRNTQGPSNAPFTIIAREGQFVAFSVVIYETIDAPLTALALFHSGFLVHTQLGDSLINRLRPR